MDLEEALARIAELEPLAARAAGLEAAASDHQARIAALEGELARAQEQVVTHTASIDQLNTSLAHAVDAYRQYALKARPEIPPDLVSGASIAEVDASIAEAEQIVARIKAGIAAAAAAHVPNGSAARITPDLASLSPLEKIKLGLAATS